MVGQAWESLRYTVAGLRELEDWQEDLGIASPNRVTRARQVSHNAHQQVVRLQREVQELREAQRISTDEHARRMDTFQQQLVASQTLLSADRDGLLVVSLIAFVTIIAITCYALLASEMLPNYVEILLSVASLSTAFGIQHCTGQLRRSNRLTSTIYRALSYTPVAVSVSGVVGYYGGPVVGSMSAFLAGLVSSTYEWYNETSGRRTLANEAKRDESDDEEEEEA